jgi:hypothetical protein
MPIQIPLAYVGPLKSFVMVLSNTNAQDATYVTVDVEPQTSIRTMSVDRTTVALVAPNTSKVFSSLTQDQLTVNGIFADNVSRDISQSTQTLFSSANPRVVTVDSMGHLTAIAPGSAIVTVTNSGISAAALVQVNIFPLHGDLNGDGDVDRDDVNMIVKALNTSSTGPGDPRDLDGDGRIDVGDVRLEKTLCTRPRCAANNDLKDGPQ